jgi:hypothetical protein
MYTNNSDRNSLAWLLLSAIGSALAAIVVAGVIAGRMGLPIAGSWLLGAGILGALPRVLMIARGRWLVHWPEFAAVLIGFVAVGGVGLALAWPALLPLGFSVDAIHHTQLIAWLADQRALPSPGGSTQGLLGEMAAYPIGLALLVLTVASGTGRPLLEATYPTVAMLGGLIAATVVLLSSAATSELRIENERLRNRSLRNIFNSQFSILNFLALLVGPLLLLTHRTYLMEAYTDHSYYTMVLGILLVLLATAWLMIQPPRSFGSAAQFGLVLAALMCTYPLWVPLPAGLALIMIVTEHASRRGNRSPSLLVSLSPALGHSALALGPALALAMLDVLPRMRIGQTVLAHEGLVTLPTTQRLMPILLALPCALLAARGPAGRRLVGMAALAALATGALALAMRGGMAAGYHSYKLLFVLTPLAAAIVGAALARLTTIPAITLKEVDRQAHATRRVPAIVYPFVARYTALAFNDGWLAHIQPNSNSFPITNQHPRNWAWTNANEPGRMSVVGHRLVLSGVEGSSILDNRFRWLALSAAMLLLVLTGSFQIIPAPAAQVISPNTVAATRWLRANAPKDAARAISVGVPAGPLSYWIEVGLLGQRRDKSAAAQRDFTITPPTRESWLIDQQLPPVAITTAAGMPLPGESILARFGDVAVVRRAPKLDPVPLNPLLIRYRSFWEEGRLKTAIELQRPLLGPLPLLDLRLYHAGAPVATFALPPEQDRTRAQYLGADLLPDTLRAEGYINQSAYPVFDAPTIAPTGALSLTLRLTLAGDLIEERLLASFERASDGQIAQLAPCNGELIYLRHDPPTADLRAVDLDFGGTLRLMGWAAPARATAGSAIEIGLRWQALQTLDHALFPELLILNAAGQPVAHSLAAPQDGFYPTWRWRPGESVAEQRRIQLPPDLAPGVYQVVARIHDFAAGRVLNTPGSADGIAPIGEIMVE